MALAPSIHRLDSGPSTLVFDLRAGHAELAHVGPGLSPADDLAGLCDVRRRAPHECEPDRPVPRSVLPLTGTGYPGSPLVEVARAGRGVEVAPGPIEAEQGGGSLRFSIGPVPNGVRIDTCWRAAGEGVFTADTTVTNEGDPGLQLMRCAALGLPLPRWARVLVSHSGRWASELHARRVDLADAPHLGGRSHGGRPGFSGGQWLLFEEVGTTEGTGSCLAVHLAWSGDHEWQVETDADGNAMLLVGPRLRPGEVELACGEAYTTPAAVLAVSSGGRGGLRWLLHRYVTAHVLPPVSRQVPRKVHLNTWEACGFDLDADRLLALATDAAALGVERFVLDDGWFGTRRDDTSGLGDWQASPDRFPEGLDPLIRHVHALGMDFGLWVEPEMVSPDSELYRAHPDWCIHVDGVPRATQRGQLVLDLARPDVAEYVLASIDALLERHAIAYLKWDHNRDLFPVAGRGVAQTRAVYGLLDRIRARHPALEIESCASGGGRVDYAILSRCTRFWASDNNDPVERMRINRSWLQFLPLRACGNHVGPSPNPVTGRTLPMDFRAKVALFGHMGVEADPGTMPPDDRRILTEHIALYTMWREVLHEGDLHELSGDDDGISGWLAVHGSRALALVARTSFARHFESAPVRLPGLDPARRYRVRLPEPWPDVAARQLVDPGLWREGIELSGQVLRHAGLTLPLRHPATAWLVSLEAR